jgi:hypothetical protein
LGELADSRFKQIQDNSEKAAVNVQYVSKVYVYIGYSVSGGAVVEALRYKPEGHGIDSRWCHWNISLT